MLLRCLSVTSLKPSTGRSWLCGTLRALRRPGPATHTIAPVSTTASTMVDGEPSWYATVTCSTGWQERPEAVATTAPETVAGLLLQHFLKCPTLEQLWQVAARAGHWAFPGTCLPSQLPQRAWRGPDLAPLGAARAATSSHGSSASLSGDSPSTGAAAAAVRQRIDASLTAASNDTHLL